MERLKERNEKDQERRAQRLLQKKTLQDEDGEVQDLAVLKRSKRATDSNGKKLYYSYLSFKSFAHPNNVLTFSILVANQLTFDNIIASSISDNWPQSSTYNS